MRIGIVSWWFNRGQAVVARYLRGALDELGHQTFVLARPTKEIFARPGFVDDSDVWSQPDVTRGSAYNMSVDEYLAWAEASGIDAVFTDQNYQFQAIAALRDSEITTLGRFVWEDFSPDHVTDAARAFDCIYSLTLCEQARYRDMGIESPLIPWGCHPELLEVPRLPRTDGTIRFFYPGGYLSRRKPTEAVLEAFRSVENPAARLVVKAQDPARSSPFGEAARHDPRIEIISDDLPAAEYFQLFAGCDVSLAPSRWEGLGLHLYEAVAFGLPTITNDAPPMSEMVGHDVDGWLVPGRISKFRRPGVPALEVDVEALAQGIAALCDDDRRERLASGVARRRESRRWSRTVDAYRRLLAEVMG